MTPAELMRPRRKWVWGVAGVVVVSAAAAVGVWRWRAGAGQDKPAPVLAPVAVDAQVTVAARDALAELVEAQHAAMAAGDGDALAATYAPELFRIGTDAVDVFASRDAGLVALRRALDGARKQGATLTASADRLLIGRAPGGHAAWIAEELDWSSVVGKRVTRARYLVTQVAAEVAGRWRIIASHWARGVPDAKALRAAAQGKLPPPYLMPAGEQPLPGSSPAPVLAAARSVLASKQSLLAALAERPDVVVMGSALGELRSGPAEARSFLRDLGGELALDGDLRAGASPDGEVGWAAANLSYLRAQPQRDGDAGQLRLGFRVLAVLLRDPTASASGGYRVVQLQFSLGGPLP